MMFRMLLNNPMNGSMRRLAAVSAWRCHRLFGVVEGSE
jgi:hypothetical protein